MLQNLFKVQLRHRAGIVSPWRCDGAAKLRLQDASILVEKKAVTEQQVAARLFSRKRVPQVSAQPLAETKTGRMCPAWWRICGVVSKPNIIFL